MTDQAKPTEDHLGQQGAHPDIAVLAPYRPAVGTYPVSPRTGEPTRPVVLGIAVALFVAGAVLSSVGLVKVLWDAATVTGYHSAARVLEWTKPEPVSFLTIVMVLTIGAIGALVATACGTIAYNAWHGRRWARIGGVVAVAISGLTYLLNPLATVSIVPVVVAAALLWLPDVARYFEAWGTIRTAPMLRRGWAENVRYGIQPRYRREAS
jgi:hypothetical protein